MATVCSAEFSCRSPPRDSRWRAHTEGQVRRALTLVPDLHMCVLTAGQIVGDVPEAVARLRASVDTGRPLTWVSGPSATIDSELIRVHRVHVPRTLRVVLVESAPQTTLQKQSRSDPAQGRVG